MPVPLRSLLDESDSVHITVDDLRFTPAETEQVLMLESATAVDRARWLHAAVDGWPAAIAVAARQLDAVSGQPRIQPDTGLALLHRLMSDTIDRVDEDHRRMLPTLGALPVLDQQLVDRLFGAGAFDRYVDAGLPIVQRPDGWSVLSDPVRDVLATIGSVDRDVVDAAAPMLRQAGEVTAAAELVARYRDPVQLASFLDGCTTDHVQTLGVPRISAYLTMIDDDTMLTHPTVLYRAAVAAETRNDTARREWLARAASLTECTDPVLFRQVRAEQLIDCMRFEQPATVLVAYQPLLDAMGPTETAARGRVLMAAVVAHVMSDTPSSRHELRPMLRQAVELFRVSGMRRWEAEALRRLGYSIELHLGEYDRASEAFRRALALLPAPDRDRAMALAYFAEVLETCGRVDEAQAALREAGDIAGRTGDTRSAWFTAWTALLMAARIGDRVTVRRLMAEIDRTLGSIPDDGNGFEYLVTVADALAGMGDLDTCRRLLDQARPLAVRLARESAVMMVEARLEALDGDPAEAERLLDRIEGMPYAVPEQRWVRLLERAVAVKRSGDLVRARHVAEAALASARDQGQPDLPARFEPRLVDLVRDLFDAGAGLPTSIKRVSLLGRFGVSGTSGDISPAPGNPTTLVALVALRGRVDVDETIELLWPDIEIGTGRARLRNLLNRVRDRTGDLIEREGTHLVIDGAAEIDAAVFERLADDALSAAGPDRCGLARHAVAHWSGELLPGLRFEDWTTGPRERLKRRYLSLLDIVIDDAVTRDDFDDAVRHLELAIEQESLDEQRHVRIVEVLLRQGRRTAALRALDRAQRVADDLGVESCLELRLLHEHLIG